MTIRTHSITPYPFKPLRSFLAYAVGDEKIELRPEWAEVVLPSVTCIARKEAA